MTFQNPAWWDSERVGHARWHADDWTERHEDSSVEWHGTQNPTSWIERRTSQTEDWTQAFRTERHESGRGTWNSDSWVDRMVNAHTDHDHDPWKDIDQPSWSSDSTHRQTLPVGVNKTLACRNDGRSMAQMEEYFAKYDGFTSICCGPLGKNCFLKFTSNACAATALERAISDGYVIQYSQNKDSRNRSNTQSSDNAHAINDTNSYHCNQVPPVNTISQVVANVLSCQTSSSTIVDVGIQSDSCVRRQRDKQDMESRVTLLEAASQEAEPQEDTNLVSRRSSGIGQDRLLQAFEEQRTWSGNYVACWNVACIENPQWLTLKISVEGWISPWCKLCSAFADQHLYTPKCRNQVQKRGLTPGVFLKNILDNDGTLPTLTESQLRLPPSPIWPIEVKTIEQKSGSSSTPSMLGPVHVQPRLSLETVATHEIFLADASRQYRCANPVCSFLINPDPRSGGFCCKNCSDHYDKGKRGKTIDHGRYCKRLDAPVAAPRAPPVPAQSLKSGPGLSSALIQVNAPESFPPLLLGHWRATEKVLVQEGLDVDTRDLRTIQRHEVWKQAGEPILIREGSNQSVLKLRLPLSPLVDNEQYERFGWATVAEKQRGLAGSKVFFQASHNLDLEDLLLECKSFECLWSDVKAAFDDMEQSQESLRHEVNALTRESLHSSSAQWLGLASLVANRDNCRESALRRVRDICDIPSVSLCLSQKWSGCGERESCIDLAQTWLFHLERAGEVKFEEKLKDLELSRQIMRQARVAVKKTNLALEIAPDEGKSKEDIDTLKNDKTCKERELRLRMRDHRRNMCSLIDLAEKYFPEHRREIIEIEKDFLQFNVQSDTSAWQVLDFERELSFYQNASVISDENARHTVYAAEDFDGKPCVLKRIDWHSAEGSKAFVKEVTTLVKVRHPLIVSVQCAFMDPSSPQFGYLQFERLECNLEEWMMREVDSGVEDVMKSCSIVYALIQAVVWIHSQDVLHCDIKPSNFLWDAKKSIPRLHDFETAREDSASSSARCGTTTRIPYTWEYLAPELMADPASCPRTKPTDMFALGRTVKRVVDKLVRSECSQGKLLLTVAGDAFMTHEDAHQRMTGIDAEETCCELFYRECVDRDKEELCRPGVVSIEIVRCCDVRFTQRTISNRFKDGQSFDDLISALVEDPSYALRCPSLTLEAVRIDRWIHSNDNRRLHCFQEAQKWIPEDLWIRIKKYDFGRTFQRLMGRYNTRTNGTSIQVNGRSFYDRAPRG